MKKLLIFLCLLIVSPAFATYYTRTDCGTIVGPVEGDVCTQTTTVSGRTSGHLYIYRSAAWVDVDSAGTGAPTDTTYITQTPDGGLSNEQALSTLATGIVKNTTTTGVLSIASPGTDYVAPTGSGAGLTALNASALGSGTAPTARLGSGVADTTTFLRGDNSWASPTVGALSANGANCSAGNAPLGVDAAGAVEGCFDVATQAELNTHGGLTGTSAHGATTTNTASQIVVRDGSGNFAAGVITATLTGNVTGNVTGNAATATTANALTANGADCAAGEAPIGVDASGAAEGCVDVATQAEVDALTHGQLGELDDDDHAAIYTKFEASAGVPAAGSCDRAGQIQFDTTNSVAYGCYDVGSNPVNFGDQGDSFLQVTGDTGSATASGGSTLNLAGAGVVGVVCADGTPDTCTITGTEADTLDTVFDRGKTIDGANSLANAVRIGDGTNQWCIYRDAALGLLQVPCTAANARQFIQTNQTGGWYDEEGAADILVVDPDAATTLAMYTFGTAYKPKKSIWFGADSLYGDGTQCPSSPTAVTINTGPIIPTFICTDNDAASLYGSVRMPDAWDGGTVTFTHVYIQTAADTGVLNGDIACQARSNGEVPSSTYGTEVALDDAAVVGSNSNDQTTSAAATCAGTGVAGGDMLYFRYQLDAGGTTTAVATLHHVGFNMEYSVTSLSD